MAATRTGISPHFTTLSGRRGKPGGGEAVVFVVALSSQSSLRRGKPGGGEAVVLVVALRIREKIN